MKSKILSLISLSILSLVLMVSCVSAVNLISLDEISSPANTSHDSSFQIIFNITNDDVAGSLDWSDSDFTSSQTGLTFSFDDSFSLIADGSSTEVTEIITATISFDEHEAGTITGNINIATDGSAGTTETLAFSVEILDSSELSITKGNELTKIQNGTVSVTNDGNVDITNIDLMVTSTSNFEVLFDDSDFTLTPNQTIEVEIYSINIEDVDFSDDRTFTIKANNSETESNTLDYEVSMDFYEGENEGDLKIKDIDFSVEEGFGDDEEYWYPLDEVEVIVEIENERGWEVEDIEIFACLLDTDTGICVIDEGDMDLSDDDFDLDKNDDITLTLTFNIDPDDLEAGNENYEFYVSAIGNIDDSNAPDAIDGDETGDSDSKEIKIRTKDKFIILDDFQFNGLNEDMMSSEAILCGSEVQITADVWNIGDEKIDEEDVHILIYNKELGINEVITDLEDISALDNEVLEFTFNVPEDTEAKTYYILFRVYDDEDVNSDDVYENSEDDKSEFNVAIKIDGNCKLTDSALITATLTSEAQSGEQLTVKTTITNTENKVVTYTLNVKDYAEWATLEDVDKTLTLVAGESRDVTLTFNVNKGVEGSKTFNIETISDSEVVTTQPVSVSIAAQKSLIGGFSLPENNLYLWGIGALNVLLILSIIVVAIRLSKE